VTPGRSPAAVRIVNRQATPRCDSARNALERQSAQLGTTALTVIVTAKVNDGIVLAADSAATFFGADGHPLKIYNNANKIFNLVKVWPVGALVYGSGGIGSASVETLSKDLRRRFSDSEDAEYFLNRGTYTIQEEAVKARRLLPSRSTKALSGYHGNTIITRT
jgi:hypothetical protein